MTRMSREEAAALLKEASAQLAAADALLARHGEDHPDGTVIRFRKLFPSRAMDAFPPVMPEFGVDFDEAARNAYSVTLGAVYNYAAIRVNGRWYTTGPKSPKGYTWEQLLDWLDDPVPAPEPIEVLTKGWPATAIATATEHDEGPE